MPDGDSLVWRQVDHGLGGEEPVDLSFGGVLGAEVSNVNDSKDFSVMSLFFALHFNEIIQKLIVKKRQIYYQIVAS